MHARPHADQTAFANSRPSQPSTWIENTGTRHLLPLRFHPFVAEPPTTYQRQSLNNVFARPSGYLSDTVKTTRAISTCLESSSTFSAVSVLISQAWLLDHLGNVPQCLAISCLMFCFSRFLQFQQEQEHVHLFRVYGREPPRALTSHFEFDLETSCRILPPSTHCPCSLLLARLTKQACMPTLFDTNTIRRGMLLADYGDLVTHAELPTERTRSGPGQNVEPSFSGQAAELTFQSSQP